MVNKKVDIDDLGMFVFYHCIKNDIEINHFKLQKILYYIQAWHLAYFDNETIFDELPEAWVNGPVYRTIYNSLKIYKANDRLTISDNHKDNLSDLYKEKKDKLDLNEEQWEFLSSILNHYGLMSHEKLIFLTHKENPWNEARKNLGAFEYSDQKISLESMYKYYKKVLDKK
jgi:uncharacterized phage-associated protein